ncbi:monogalactosyldiacylglycerol synthase [Thermincola ferriacetica]|uniref:Monogalactosyldiacylglycerol synthase n=1 Tax=Thermincola ferriacetica TaxID=281456 RepID=A0A0L6W6R3_9FIRM|nr:glycosyltransferase [Thermincola ferriacetica]KNZ71210.1 monogalactosyldiacylglycerol synthase [Thermincola ferriacetica]
MRFLFFSVSIGAGHDLAALGLMAEIKNRFPGAETMLVNTFDYINPTLNKVIVGSYMESLKFSPKIWGKLYAQAEEGDQFIDLRQILHGLWSSKLEKLVDSFAPDAVICTHAFPAGMLSMLKGRGLLDVPLLAILTDYTVHSFWLHDHIDTYIIPTEELKYLFIRHGIKAEKIKAFGIPVRPEFSQLPSKEEARTSMQLENKTTFLVMGGGLGLGDVKNIIVELGNSDLDINIIAVAGKNHKLQTALDLLQTKANLKVFGFTEEIPRLMAASDVIVTKPGGLTTAEVLATGIPMVIMSPLPGQEERNTEFLLNCGVAVKVRKLDLLIPTVKQLLENPVKIKQVKEMCRVLGRPKAAADTVDYLLNLVESK